MASKQIRISIQSALNAAGITATKDQINKLGDTFEEFNRKQARVAKETGQS